MRLGIASSLLSEPAVLLLALTSCESSQSPRNASAMAQQDASPAPHADVPTGGAAAGTGTGSSATAANSPQRPIAGASGAKFPAASAGTSSQPQDAGPTKQPAQDASVGGSQSSADASQTDASVPQGTRPPIVCPKSALKPGGGSGMLTHGGVERSFLTFVPKSYDNTKPLPLVVNFHGGNSNAAQQIQFSNMNPTADAKGFIVVYPEGLNGTWDAGACCAQTKVDDVGFARAVVERMKELVCVDPQRVYATGMSNGGRMSYRVGCEAADLFAAIAPVAGIKSFPDLVNTPGCKPARPISLIDFQGTADERHIEYQPGQIKEWVGFNGCTDAAPQETFRMGEHYCSTYSQCKAGTSVTFCVVPDGGHCWPGSYPCVLGDTSMPDELSANELMWKLFERSTL